MKENSTLLVVALVTFTGIYAQEIPGQEDQSFFENFKDALAASDPIEGAPVTDAQETETLMVNEDQPIED